MAENSESWFVKLGVLFDGTGFKKFGIAAFDVKKTITNLYDTFKKVSAMGGDLSRTSRYLDISSDRLQVWERAFGLMGGSAEDARSAINSLNFAFDKLRLGEGGGLAQVAARLRLRPEDLTSFETMIEALNRSYNTYFKDNYGQFKVLAEQMGLSKSAILMVTQSAQEYQRTMQRASSIPLLKPHHLKAFESLEKRFFLFSKRFDIFKAQMASSFAPAFDRILGKLEELFNNPELNSGMQNMMDSFEKLFNELANTENLEAFGKVVTAVAEALVFLTKAAAKVPKAMEWIGDKLGTFHGWVEKKLGGGTEFVPNENMIDKSVVNNAKSLPQPQVDMGKFASSTNNNNVVINQTNNITGDNSEDIADEVANKTASVVNPYREQRNINNRKAVTVH